MSKDGNEPGIDTTMLPVLPESWSWARVAEVADVQGGIQKQPKRKPVNNAYPYLRVANVHRNRLDLSEIHQIELFGEELTRLRLEAGDLLIVEGNGSLTEIGRSALWNGAIENCVHQNHIIRVRFLAGVPQFLNYFWNSTEGNQRVMDSAASTSGLYTLSVTKVSRLPVPVAPAAEQKRIASKVDELFSDLDAGVAALQRVKAKLKRYRAAVLKAAVEGKLTEEWRKKNRPKETGRQLLDRILQERRCRWEQEQVATYEKAGKKPPAGWKDKYKEPVGPDETSLPALPEGWCWASVEQTSHFTRYGSSAKTSEDSSGIAVLRMGNIRDGTLDCTSLKYLPSDHHEFPELLLEPGDLLFNRTNSAELVGKSAVYAGQPEPCSYASYLISVRFVGGCDSRHVAYYLNSIYGRQWVASVVCQQVGQANVNGSKLQRLAIPLPPVPEQQQIIAEVERCHSLLTEAESQFNANLKRSARLRQSILKRAFEGKLVPQDPTDEPASVLLDRIKAGRDNRTGRTNGVARTRLPRRSSSRKQQEENT